MWYIEPRYCVPLKEINYIHRTEQVQVKPFLNKMWWCKFYHFAIKSLIPPQRWRCVITDRHKSDQGHKIQLRLRYFSSPYHVK